eukprot:gene5760-9581_t
MKKIFFQSSRLNSKTVILHKQFHTSSFVKNKNINEKKDVLYDLFIKLNKNNKKYEKEESDCDESSDDLSKDILVDEENRGNFDFKIKHNQQKIDSEANLRIKEIEDSYLKSLTKGRKNELFDFLRKFQSVVTSESLLFPSDMKMYTQKGKVVEYILENNFQIGIDFGNGTIMNDLGNHVQKDSVQTIFEWNLQGSLSDFILLIEEFVPMVQKGELIKKFHNFLNTAYETEIEINSEFVSKELFGDVEFKSLFFSHLLISSSKYITGSEGKLYVISTQISTNNVDSFLERAKKRKKQFTDIGYCRSEWDHTIDEPILKILETYAVHDIIDDIYLNIAQIELCEYILKEFGFEGTPEDCDRLLEFIIPRELQRKGNFNARTAFSTLYTDYVTKNRLVQREISALKKVVKSKIGNYHPDNHKHRVDLRHLTSYAIDSRSSAFLDDSVSFDGNDIYMHVVNSTEFIEPNSLLEKSIKSRFETKYRKIKHKKVTPKFVVPVGALKLLSLNSSRDNFCLTVKVTMDLETSKILSQSIFPSIISPVTRIHKESKNIEQLIPNYEKYIDLFENSNINKKTNFEGIELFVSHFMVLANKIAFEYCMKHQIIKNVPHHQKTIKTTSPLRRYSDHVAQRQIYNHILGLPFVYSTNEIQLLTLQNIYLRETLEKSFNHQYTYIKDLEKQWRFDPKKIFEAKITSFDLNISTVQLMGSKIPIKLHLVTYGEAKSIIEFLRYQGKSKYEGIPISSFDRFEKDLKI